MLYIDPSVSGISGNMMLGALIDLGGEEKILFRAADVISEKLNCRIEVRRRKVRKKDISATYIELEIRREPKDIKPSHLSKILPSIAEELSLSQKAADFASKVFQTLLDAEAAAHGTAPDKLHLHELGSADTLVDIVGTAALADAMGFFEKEVRIYSAPVAVGKGEVKTKHGTLPVPTPVTAEILKAHGIPFKFSSTEGELATPTGVAILANFVNAYYELPVMKVEAIGMGAGTRELPDAPNILRIMQCRTEDYVSVLETNLDDVSGEVIGYTLERLYEEGALDVQIIPTTTKKARPGYIIITICSQGEEEKLARILMEETGTLGIRISKSQQRFHLSREVRPFHFSMPGYKGEAKVKIATDRDGNILNIKAEYEDAKRIAKEAKVPIRRVISEIERQADKILR